MIMLRIYTFYVLGVAFIGQWVIPIAANSTDIVTVLPAVKLPSNVSTATLDPKVTNSEVILNLENTTDVPAVSTSAQSETTHEEESSAKSHNTGASFSTSSKGSNSTYSTNTEPVKKGEPYSWWKIVVTLVVFCVMAGVILWILQVAEKCQNKDKEDLNSIEEESSASSTGSSENVKNGRAGSTDKISRV